MTTFRYAHLVLGGFWQHIGGENGMHRLADALYHRWAAPETLVEYWPWRISPQHVAAHLSDLDRLCREVHAHRLTIHVIGFSFGGMTAVEVCRRLIKQGVCVDALLLTDAVARRGRFGLLRALNPYTEIRVPPVLRATAYIQRHRRFRFRPPFFFPSGHRLSWSAQTDYYGPYTLEREHAAMDSAEEVWQDAFDQAAHLHGLPPDRHAATIPFDPHLKVRADECSTKYA